MIRCHEEGVLVSEELYPAVDETNPLLKNKKVSKINIIFSIVSLCFFVKLNYLELCTGNWSQYVNKILRF